MSDILSKAVHVALGERERESRTQRFFNDPVAWAKYMLDADLWSKQREISNDLMENRNVAVKAGHGVGKLVTYATPIWTPEGFVQAGTLKVGDKVFDESGTETNITALSPVWDRPEYEVTFDDGSKILCGPEHEWNVLDLSRRTAAMKRGVDDWRDHWDSTKTYETQELMGMGTETNSGQKRWRIPTARPLQMPEADLPVDPYLLGFWLGDGTTTSGAITIGTTKTSILGWLYENDIEYSLRAEWDKGRAAVTPKALVGGLREAGVLGNKHIPIEYLRASERQRRELLAGIMDSDGFLLKPENGADVGIDLTNKRLAEDVYTLLMSLGCKVRWSEGEAAYTLNGERTVTGVRYRMNWVPLENPFKIRGQGWREPVRQRSRHTQRTIVGIERTGRSVKNFCITVDSPRHLYLAGKSMVPTHNSFLVSILICHWVDTRYPNAFVASTAPSTAQIGAIVWREIRRMYAQIEKRFEAGLIDHKLPGKINADAKNNEWKDKSGQLIGFGRKPPEGKEDDNFQGIHDGYVLAVGDEAVGLSPEMIDALGNITSNPNSRRIIIANPTNPASYMGKIFKEDTGAWKLHTISVFDSPNFTDERHTMSQAALDRLTGPEYVEDKKKEYGENSARYKARVLGEFAFDNANSLISQDDITPALNAEIDPSAESRPELGVDVARFGDDVTVVYMYHDGQLRYLDSWSKAPTTETSNRVHRLAIDTAAKVVKIDAGGVGGGVVDQVSQMSGSSYTVVGLNSSGASPDKKQWHNVRAFWWDDFRSRCRKGEIDIDVQDEKAETLQDELMSPQYKYGNTGGLLIESKDEMRKRGMKSPDFADAAVFAAADVSFLIDDPINELEPGSHVLVDMEHFDDQIDFLGCW